MRVSQAASGAVLGNPDLTESQETRHTIAITTQESLWRQGGAEPWQLAKASLEEPPRRFCSHRSHAAAPRRRRRRGHRDTEQHPGVTVESCEAGKVGRRGGSLGGLLTMAREEGESPAKGGPCRVPAPPLLYVEEPRMAKPKQRLGSFGARSGRRRY